jgi:hypothetical protein
VYCIIYCLNGSKVLGVLIMIAHWEAGYVGLFDFNTSCAYIEYAFYTDSHIITDMPCCIFRSLDCRKGYINYVA